VNQEHDEEDDRAEPWHVSGSTQHRGEPAELEGNKID
jgi:hypothetical protein